LPIGTPAALKTCRPLSRSGAQRASLGIGRTLELGHTEAIEQAVMAGLGVAFVSIYAARAEWRPAGWSVCGFGDCGSSATSM
jgi:DNA-binding transcriptional LysR family regulator